MILALATWEHPARKCQLDAMIRRDPKCAQSRYLEENLVRLTREDLNSLFEALEEWERHPTQLDLRGRERGDEASKKRFQ